ncbi:MAG: hypothetical protein QM723_34125 [Myxococcaceae bacterium]
MKELESPICEAMKQVAENEDAREYVESESAPWFKTPVEVEGDEPLTFELSRITDTLRRNGLV